MNFSDHNVWAILVATLVNQVIGAVWYSPLLFAKPWVGALGLTPEQLKALSPKIPLVVSLFSALMLAVALSFLLGFSGSRTVAESALAGLFLGVGVAAMSSAPHYAFGGLSLKLYLINQGMAVVNVLVMSVIIGVWR